jgi:hypothetical protein
MLRRASTAASDKASFFIQVTPLVMTAHPTGAGTRSSSVGKTHTHTHPCSVPTRSPSSGFFTAMEPATIRRLRWPRFRSGNLDRRVGTLPLTFTAGAAAGVTVAKNRFRASRYANKSSMLRRNTVSLIKLAAVQPTDCSATFKFSNTCVACRAKLPLPTMSPLRSSAV